MNAPSEINVLSLVCSKLDNSNIPYMLTGSFASNFYTVPRMTRDIDIVIELDQINKKLLFKALENDFYISEEAITDAIDHESMFNAIHNDTIFKVDFIIRKNANYRRTEFGRRQQKVINNQSIWIVAPEDLIISKLFWAKESLSQMQINDIKSLLQSVPSLDKKYLESWIDKLQLSEIYGKVYE